MTIAITKCLAGHILRGKGLPSWALSWVIEVLVRLGLLCELSSEFKLRVMT